MRKQDEFDARIRQALDARFSGVTGQLGDAERVLRLAKGEEKPVKKKLSVGFVLVIVLVLAAVTALAAMTLNAYYEKAIEKEGQNGLIQNWSAADKVALVDWMVDAGIALDEDQVAQLHSADLSEDEQGTLAMEIIKGYYPARDGILTSVDIIAKEKGPIEYWSLEDKAWFSEMMAKYQPEEVTYGRNLLPAEEDITQEQAESVLFSYLQEHNGIDKDSIMLSTLTAFFGENTFDVGNGPVKLRCWVLNVDLADGNEAGGYIGADGAIIDISVTNYQVDWVTELDKDMRAEDFFTVEGMNRFDQKWRPLMQTLQQQGENVESSDLPYFLEDKQYGLPVPEDITRDEAYRLASNAIAARREFPQDVLTYYDKTHEAYRTEKPDGSVYWFTFFRTWEDEAKSERAKSLGLPASITVQVDARTGKIADVTMSGLFFTEPTERFGM